MARWSKTSQSYKLEDGDTVKVYGIRAKVETVMVEKSTVATHVTVFARVNNAEDCNVFNLSDIEAVSVTNRGWMQLNGEVAAI
jgi:hypothetical protein